MGDRLPREPLKEVHASRSTPEELAAHSKNSIIYFLSTILEGPVPTEVVLNFIMHGTCQPDRSPTSSYSALLLIQQQALTSRGLTTLAQDMRRSIITSLRDDMDKGSCNLSTGKVDGYFSDLAEKAVECHAGLYCDGVASPETPPSASLPPRKVEASLTQRQASTSLLAEEARARSLGCQSSTPLSSGATTARPSGNRHAASPSSCVPHSAAAGGSASRVPGRSRLGVVSKGPVFHSGRAGLSSKTEATDGRTAVFQSPSRALESQALRRRSDAPRRSASQPISSASPARGSGSRYGQSQSTLTSDGPTRFGFDLSPSKRWRL